MAKFEKGNKLSQIGEEKSAEYIHARCTLKQKVSYRKAADQCNKNTSRWICDTLDEVIRSENSK